MLNIISTISLFVLGSLFFYPFTYCPFHLPYIYCFICPTRCAGGKVRGIILLVALGLNINRDAFCRRLCPVGSVQALLFKLKLPKFALPKFIRSCKYIILVLIVIAVLLTLTPQPSQIFIGKVKALLIAILLFSFAASIFIDHPFCRNFCPVRALSKVLPKVRR